MNFVSWTITIILVYLALGRLFFVIGDSVLRKRWYLPVAYVMAIASALSGTYVVSVLEASGFFRSHNRLQSLIVTFSVLFLLFSWLVDRASMRRTTWQQKKRRRELSRQIKLHLTLTTGALIFSVPFYWLITTSLKPDERTNRFPPDLIPMKQASTKIDGVERKIFFLNRDGARIKVVKMNELEGGNWEVKPLNREEASWTVAQADLKEDLHPVAMWSNYKDALDFLPEEYDRGLKPLWNTVYATLLTIIGTVLSSSMVAFAFSRLRWPGRDLLFVIMLATMMIPAAVTMLPVFLIFRELGWIDTLRPLWFPAFFGSGFNIFLLRQFFMTIPNELEDAAKIDGCSYFRIYWTIMLPLIKPALAALTIFAFMGSWNNFMGPLIYISSPEKMTLAYALQLFQGSYGGEPGMMMASATLVMLPVLIVFFFTQRYMIQGVTLTGLK